MELNIHRDLRFNQPRHRPKCRTTQGNGQILTNLMKIPTTAADKYDTYRTGQLARITSGTSRR